MATMPDIDTLFDAMIAGIGGNPADARESLSTFSPPVPGPYPTTGSMYNHQPEHKGNVFNNVSDMIQTIPHSLAPNALQIPIGVSDQHAHVHNPEVAGFTDMFQLEHPYTSTTVNFPLQPMHDRLPAENETECHNLDMRNIKQTEIHPMQKEVQASSSTLLSPPNTQSPWREELSNDRKALSLILHARPSDDKSERPIKRQRRAENAAAIDRTTKSLQPLPDPSSHTENLLHQDPMIRGRDSHFLSMPVVDDSAIRRNLTLSSIGYPWTNTAGNSIRPGRDIAAHQENDYPYSHIRRPLSSANVVPTPEGNVPLHAPEVNSASVNATNLFTSALRSDIPSSVVGIAGSPSYPASGARNIVHDLTTPSEVGNNAAGGTMRDFRSNHPPLSSNTTTIPETNGEGIRTENLAQADHHLSTRNSPQPATKSFPIIFDVTAKASSSSESLGPHNEDPGKISSSEDMQELDETAMGIPISEELHPTGTKKTKTHFAVATLENPPECDVCKNLYLCEEDLKMHMKAAHTQSQSHICKECNAVYKNKTNLDRHVHSSHGVRNFHCDSCAAAFSTKRSLVIHKRDQHNVTPVSVQRKKSVKQPRSGAHEKKVLTYYQCLLCPHTSTVKGNLMRHVRGKHLHERPFICPYCNKRAKTKQNIDFHKPVCAKRTQNAPDEG